MILFYLCCLLQIVLKAGEERGKESKGDDHGSQNDYVKEKTKTKQTGTLVLLLSHYVKYKRQTNKADIFIVVCSMA